MSDPISFDDGFKIGQDIRGLLDQAHHPALTAVLLGIVRGLQDGLAQAADLLQDQLQHDVDQAQLDRAHQAELRARGREQEIRAQEREEGFP